jgi:hypothetical protein
LPFGILTWVCKSFGCFRLGTGALSRLISSARDSSVHQAQDDERSLATANTTTLHASYTCLRRTHGVIYACESKDDQAASLVNLPPGPSRTSPSLYPRRSASCRNGGSGSPEQQQLVPPFAGRSAHGLAASPCQGQFARRYNVVGRQRHRRAVAAAASGLAAAQQDDVGMFQALKNVASFFSYITSKWAIATFAIVGRAALHVQSLY